MPEPTAVLETQTKTELKAGVLSVRRRIDFQQFKLLMFHLLDRFVNNEMLSIGGETLPFVITVAGAIAVPNLIAAVFLFPSYHGFPPKPPIPNFWTQVCEHYFFIVYSMVSMGLLTIFEADLFFPNRLDTLILSPLPISRRRMAFARVSANLVFLFVLLLGTNLFTVFAYPPVTELHVRRLFLANLCAVFAGAIFSAASCIGLQGLISCVVPSALHRQASAALQCGATAALVSTLLTLPKLFPLMDQLTRGPHARWLPPFWFLGLYECILAGPARLPQFAVLAHAALCATSLAIAIAVLSFPLAYIRRSRQAIEGSGSNLYSYSNGMFRTVLHATLLRIPRQRAVYHFISQSLRAPKHQIYLVMYAGLGLALMFSGALTAELHRGSVAFWTNAHALEAIVPGIAFWTVTGLCSALASPADPMGGWIFPITAGAPTTPELDAVRLWVTVRASIVTVTVVILAATMFPDAVPRTTYLSLLFLSVALSVLLPDILLYHSRTIPFTEIRIPLNTDLAWTLLRYIVLFPGTIVIALRIEPWISLSPLHFAASVIALLLLHSAIREASHRAIRNQLLGSNVDQLTGMLPGLGLDG